MRLVNGLILNPDTAIVLPSAKLLSSNLGERIDVHDSIVRFNYATGKDYPADVGIKTTHWFGHEKALIDAYVDPNIFQVVLNCAQWYPGLPFGCLIPNVIAVLELQRNLGLRHWPSTGLFAIKAAIEYDVKPKIYGFERQCKELYQYYYVSEVKPTEEHNHDYALEKEIINRYESDGLIEIID